MLRKENLIKKTQLDLSDRNEGAEKRKKMHRIVLAIRRVQLLLNYVFTRTYYCYYFFFIIIISIHGIERITQ